MNKRKFKNGLNVAADGNIPTGYAPWSGKTADLATVQENMEQLRRFLAHRGWPIEEVMVVGDRANLNDELALVYEDRKIRYLAGLKTQKKVHRELLLAVPEEQFYAHPLTDDRGPEGYWGIPCLVPFEHEDRVSHPPRLGRAQWPDAHRPSAGTSRPAAGTAPGLARGGGQDRPASLSNGEGCAAAGRDPTQAVVRGQVHAGSSLRG